MLQPNLVQVEFFHVVKRRVSLKSLYGEIKERLVDGGKIKTVVRFYDEGGELTRLARKTGVVDRKNDETVTLFPDATGLLLWILDIRSRWFARKSLELSKKRRRLAIKGLHRAAPSGQVMVEQEDRSFRFVHKNEIQELLEASLSSSDAWIFVFEHNDLGADENAPVAHAM